MLKQMDYLCDTFVGEIKALSPPTATMLRETVSQIKLPDMSTADEKTATANKKLISKAFGIMTTVFIVGILTALFIIKYHHVPIKEVLALNGMALILVAVTYLTVSVGIIYNFKSADPNVVKMEILNTLFPTINPDTRLLLSEQDSLLLEVVQREPIL